MEVLIFAFREGTYNHYKEKARVKTIYSVTMEENRMNRWHVCTYTNKITRIDYTALSTETT